MTTLRPKGPNVTPATRATSSAVYAITAWQSYPNSSLLEKARLHHRVPSRIIVLKIYG